MTTPKKDFNEKIKAIRDAIDSVVDHDNLDGMVYKITLLINLIGLSAELEARALKDLKDAELIAYAKHKAEKLSPNVMKIVIEGETSEERAKLKLADRLNAGLVHAIDGLRTIVSLKKTELDKSI